MRRAVGLLALLAAACTPVSERPPSVADEGPRPVREAWDVSFAVNEGGTMRARLSAGHLAAYEADSVYTLLDGGEAAQPVTVELFDDGGQPLATLRAARVVYLDTRRRIVAEGAVEVRAVGGRVLTAERVVWDEAARRVSAPGRVRFVSPTEQVEGENLTADERFDTYRLARITAQATVR